MQFGPHFLRPDQRGIPWRRVRLFPGFVQLRPLALVVAQIVQGALPVTVASRLQLWVQSFPGAAQLQFLPPLPGQSAVWKVVRIGPPAARSGSLAQARWVWSATVSVRRWLCVLARVFWLLERKSAGASC